MLGTKSGKQINTYVSDYVLFDLETTGISCNYDEIIEISAVKVRKGKIVSEFSELVNPGRNIPYAASAVNNITDDMVEDAPSIEEVLPRFIGFIEEDVLVGHNINSFDMQFIYRDCVKHFNQTISNDYIDTLKLAKIVFPNWKHRRLGDLAKHYGISTVGAHRALADCKMNQQVFELMGKALAQNNTEDNADIKYCPICASPMVKRNGRYGEFLGCSSFPDCRGTKKI